MSHTAEVTREQRNRFFFNVWRALAFNGISGDYAEFGSWGGTTFNMSHVESRRHRVKPHLWAFDSFEGLPAQQVEADRHPMWNEGTLHTAIDEFHEICAANEIPRSDYTTVEGFYEATLDGLSSPPYPDDIALAYVDCDLYSSTLSVLRFLMPRLKHGMVVAFDDYFCWSATEIGGERRAVLEMLTDHPQWHFLPYLTIGWHGQSFIVEDRSLLP